MEGLKELEKVQNVIELLHSHGIIDSSIQNPESHRFLAGFTLFLIQSHNELKVDEKCQLISDHVKKISVSFLDEALKSIGEEDNGNIGDDNPPDDKAAIETSPNDLQDVAMVDLDAMQRANSTLEDFMRSYLMFHKMDVHQPQSIFRCLPILSFAESFIYQLDTLNEKLLCLPTYRPKVTETEHGWEAKSLKMLSNDPFRPLALLLKHHGLLTHRLREELYSGVEYWALERKLCSLLSEDEVTVEDVMKAIHLKSFDYRVLNLILYELRGEEVNELHMDFLSISEFLVEVADDLILLWTPYKNYENMTLQDDVLENNFNVLRMFVSIYGASAAPYKLAKCITEAEEKYETMLKSLEPDLAMKYQRRCEEATKEGGKISGPSLGTWNIPTIIEDEGKYRHQILTAET